MNCFRSGVLLSRKVILYVAACTVYKDNTHLAIASRGKIKLYDVANERYHDGAIDADWVKSGSFQIASLTGNVYRILQKI